MGSADVAVDAADGAISDAGDVGDTIAPSCPAGDAKTVRLSTVKTPVDSGLLGALLPDFEAASGLHVVATAAEDVYGPARAGCADLVLSHYGHADVDTFVLGGYGRWPRTVFSNQVALIGPAADPAHVKGLVDVAAAFKSIAATKSPFVVNDIEGLKYLTQVLDAAVGHPDRTGWYFDDGIKGPVAMNSAALKGGYVLWGAEPFLKLQETAHLDLTLLVLADPILQRVMATIVVDPGKVPGVNAAGAAALEAYLLTAEVQAKIRAYRVPGIDQQLWWPMARSNDTSVLPR